MEDTKKMKVLKVSEVLQEIDQSIHKKENEKEQILAIRNSINKIIELEHELKGEGGIAIKEHFKVLHVPITLLLNQFLDQYITELKEIKDRITGYETDNGLITEEFIVQDVYKGLEKVEQYTQDSVEVMNDILMKVSHLVSTSYINPESLVSQINEAQRNNQKTIDQLNNLDETSTTSLKENSADLSKVSEFIGKVEGWSSSGIYLSEKTVIEIEEYFMTSDTIQNMIDDAIELSVEQGDSTFMGDISEWLDTLGKGTGGLDLVKGALAVTILSSKMLELTKDGNGNFIVKASPKWIKGSNKKYESKLAENIYRLLKSGDKTSGNPVLKYLGKYNNKPSGVLKEIIGLEKGTTRISFGKIISEHKGIFAFKEGDLKSYKAKVDVPKTVDQFKTAKGLTTVGKRIPIVGVAFSLVTNSGEFFNDENQYKSDWEKGGRFAAGIGMDVGIAGLTAGGAAIGTMIFPGVGTVIGGAVGAGIGIVGSWAVEDTVKGWGENAGKWTEETISDTTENVKDALSDASDFVSGWFR